MKILDRPQPLPADGTQRGERRRRPGVGCPSVPRSRGRLFQRHSEEIAAWSPMRRATLPARVLWSGESRRDDQRGAGRVRARMSSTSTTPFPLVTPSVLYACRDAWVPVVATIHNYKLGCANGDVLPRRTGLPRLPGRILPSRAGPRLLPRVTRVDGPRRAGLVAAHHRLADDGRGLHLHLRCAARPALHRSGFPPTAASSSTTSCLRRLSRPTSPPKHQVAYVGRLDEAKGAPFLMRAWDGFRCPASPVAAAPRGGRRRRNGGRRWPSWAAGSTIRDDGRSRPAS